MSMQRYEEQQPMAIQPVANDYMMPVMQVTQAVQRFNAVTMFVKEIMHDGTDYGTIPGTDKPTLLKPGAEKLTTFFGLSKRFVVVEREEDWSGERHGGEPFFYYLYRCQLYRGDVLIAEADGSANSMESKYRWRWAKEDDVPAHLDKKRLQKRSGAMSEFEFAIRKAETSGKYGKPAAYWQQFEEAIASGQARKVRKQTRNGESDAWEIDTTLYRVPNPDIADVVNTLQKMSQKRALIAATLLAVNASEFFTQDLEDMIIEVPATPVVDVTPVHPPQPARPAQRQATPAPRPQPPAQQAARNGDHQAVPPDDDNQRDLFGEDEAEMIRLDQVAKAKRLNASLQRVSADRKARYKPSDLEGMSHDDLVQVVDELEADIEAAQRQGK